MTAQPLANQSDQADDRPRPKWLADKLEAAKRKAKAVACPSCGQAVLHGQGDDCDQRPVLADADPVERVGPARERRLVVALLSGRPVFALHCGELHRLDDLQLSLAPGQLTLRRAGVLSDRIGPPIALHLGHRCPHQTSGDAPPARPALPAPINPGRTA